MSWRQSRGRYRLCQTSSLGFRGLCRLAGGCFLRAVDRRLLLRLQVYNINVKKVY